MQSPSAFQLQYICYLINKIGTTFGKPSLSTLESFHIHHVLLFFYTTEDHLDN